MHTIFRSLLRHIETCNKATVSQLINTSLQVEVIIIATIEVRVFIC